MTESSEREQRLKQIIELERRMFIEVRASSPSACQEHLRTFATMRRMSHSVLSDEFLESFLDDLREAFTAKPSEGCCISPSLSEHANLVSSSPRRNFFVEKYARIEGQIPPLKHSPLIADIMQIELGWFLEVQRKYPTLLRSNEAFQAYEQAELETYSDRSLQLLFCDVGAALQAGRNLVEERYENLSLMLGFSSIAQMIANSSPDSNGGCHV